MGYPIQQNQTAQPLLFLLVSSADHISPVTGVTPTVALSKNGGSFASPSGAVSELANGWYKIAGNATDASTLGPLVLHATATGADPTDDRFDVVAYNPQDATRLGLTALPNANAGANGGLPTGNASGQVTVATNNDKTGYALTNAYDAAKTAASSADYTAARAAKLDNLDAAVTSRLAGASYSAPPSAASVADAVWDEATADHAATGTTGKALANAGSAADPLTNTVPGTYASGTAGAALGRIGSGQVTTTSPVAVSGDVTIVRGDDYNAADGRALDWTDVSAAWPDLTGATIAVTVQTTATTTWTKAGSVVTPTGSGKKVRVEPTAADTATFAGGASYPFDVQATLSSGRKVTLLRGTWYVLADYSV